MISAVFDEAKAQRASARGEAASRILADPFVIEAFAEIDRAVLSAFNDVKAEDKDALQELARVRDVTKRFRGVFEAAIQKGKIAKDEIEGRKRFKLLGGR